MIASCVCLFFFQAEDGIRDYKVTGVQTCALPIFAGDPQLAEYAAVTGVFGGGFAPVPAYPLPEPGNVFIDGIRLPLLGPDQKLDLDRKSTRLNSRHLVISYAVFCLEKKNRLVCYS